MCLKSSLFISSLLLSTALYAQEDKAQTFWQKAWGIPGPTQINFGMFTYHLASPSTPIQDNDLWGITYQGYTATTLINSHGDRSYFGGVTRIVFQTTPAPDLTFQTGYRIGLIYGYSREWAQQTVGVSTALLPLPQIFTDVTWHHVGMEVDLSGLVLLSINFHVRF